MLEADTPATENADKVLSPLGGSALSTVTRYVLVELFCAVTTKSTAISSVKLYESPLLKVAEFTETDAF